MKYKVDAAIFHEMNRFGIDMCIRNNRGQFIKAKTMWFEGTPPTMEAEVIELKEAIIWLDEMDLSRMCIELDCKLVVDDIIDKSDNLNRIEYGSIMKVYRSLLYFYSNFKISFARRQANYVARCFAKASMFVKFCA
jgi:hypothetical protein